jgi:hypothetical protein
MPLAAVPNHVCSQGRTNRIEPPVTDRAYIMDRMDSTSDGICHSDPDSRRRRVQFRSWRRGTREVNLRVVHRTELAILPSDAAAAFSDARDGAAIKDVAILGITAIEDSELVIVDAP